MAYDAWEEVQERVEAAGVHLGKVGKRLDALYADVADLNFDKAARQLNNANEATATAEIYLKDLGNAPKDSW